MKEQEKEYVRLRRAVSDLTLDKLILQDALGGASELCTATALYRSYQDYDAGVRETGLLRARATSINAAPDAAWGR